MRATKVPVVLVTGFEPFGGDTVNPSWEIARRLEGWEPPVAAVVKAVLLPCVFHDALDVLNEAITRLQPVAVIGLGLAASRSDVSVERIAINVDDARIPDNAGRQPIDQPVCPGAPAAYWSTLPIKSIVAALQQAGIAASVSQSAGTFVCNHVFFGLAHRLAGRKRVARAAAATNNGKGRPAVRGGFIHVPWPVQEALDLETMVEAVRIAIRVTLTAPTDQKLPGGALD